VAPDALTSAALAVWAAVTVGGALLLARAGVRRHFVTGVTA
jgi:hypothetical protein